MGAGLSSVRQGSGLPRRLVGVQLGLKDSYDLVRLSSRPAVARRSSLN